MSQLTTNTATIDELITMANNLPDAGSGGGSGGSVETCTVTVNGGGNPLQAFYTTYENGIYGNGYRYLDGEMANVMCYTVICIEYYNTSARPTVQTSGDVELLAIGNSVGSLNYIITIRSNSSNGGSVTVTPGAQNWD